MNNLIDVKKCPIQSIPRIYGWHMLHTQPKPDKKNFGNNWWELLQHGQLSLKKKNISVNLKDTYSVVLVNLGKTPVIITDKKTKNVYNVPPYGKSIVNNIKGKVVKLSAKRNIFMQNVQLSEITMILLQIEQVVKCKSLIKKSVLYNDFFLMNGIMDSTQYMGNVSIENFTSVEVIDKWEVEKDEFKVKSDWVDSLLNQWKKCNPVKRKSAPKYTIPHKIHWIWLGLEKGKYGPLKPEFYKFMESWINKNPNFEFNVWTDNKNFEIPEKFENIVTVKYPEDIKKLIERLPKAVKPGIKYLFKNHPNVGARSDTLRQVILYLEGGIYADVNDAACLVSMEKMCNKFDFIIGLEPVMYVNNAIIASRKNHIIPKNMIAYLAANSRKFVSDWKSDYQFDSETEEKDDYIVSTTGPISYTYVIFGIISHKLLTHSLILPSAWIYPNYWIPRPPKEWVTPVAITAHYDRRDYLK